MTHMLLLMIIINDDGDYSSPDGFKVLGLISRYLLESQYLTYSEEGIQEKKDNDDDDDGDDDDDDGDDDNDVVVDDDDDDDDGDKIDRAVVGNKNDP